MLHNLISDMVCKFQKDRMKKKCKIYDDPLNKVFQPKQWCSLEDCDTMWSCLVHLSAVLNSVVQDSVVQFKQSISWWTHLMVKNKSEVLRRSLTLCGRRRSVIRTCPSVSINCTYVKHMLLFLCFVSLFKFIQSLKATSHVAVVCCRIEVTVIQTTAFVHPKLW